MTRDIPVGNMKLLITFDRDYNIRDIYYPYVGKENHVFGHYFRIGVWCEGVFSWIGKNWNISLNYKSNTLVTKVILSNKELQLQLECSDLVDYERDIYIKKMRVINLSQRYKSVRIFFTQDFHLSETGIGDTALYDPSTQALIHYKGRRYFLISLLTDKGDGIYQYATGVKEFGSAEGTWRDAEDGTLSGNPIAQGSVDSVISVHLNLSPTGVSELYYWIAAADRYLKVKELNTVVKKLSPRNIFNRAQSYWRLWLLQSEVDDQPLPHEIIEVYKKCLLIAATQVDARGAIIAANDTDIARFNRDTYSYVWPRDGSIVAMAFDQAGYPLIPRHFFNFCSKVLAAGGWFFHKYQPDGSPGSSWHPWIRNGKRQLPIQEDETGLVIYSLWKHYEKYKEVGYIRLLYEPLIIKVGDFLVRYRDKSTGLPKESYDLWEERRGIFTYTAAAVYAGLKAAANFVAAFGDHEREERYSLVAANMKRAMKKYLYSRERDRFLRGIRIEGGRLVDVDDTVDSSLAGTFLYGVFSADDPMVTSTMKTVEDRLWVKTDVGGLARYEGDRYQAVVKESEEVQGNPWFICTLWLADWYIEKAKSVEDLSRAKELLDWAVKYALPSGVMAEQIHPYNGSPLSVSPLTWSQAEFILAVNRYVSRLKLLKE